MQFSVLLAVAIVMAVAEVVVVVAPIVAHMSDTTLSFKKKWLVSALNIAM